MQRSSEVSCRWSSSSGSISHIPIGCPEGGCNPLGGIELVLEFSDCTHSGLGRGEKLWFLFRALLTSLQWDLVWPEWLWGGVSCCRGRNAQRHIHRISVGFPLDLTWCFYTSLSESISTLRIRQTCRQCKWLLLHPRQSPRNHSSCGPSFHLSLFPFFLLISSLLCLPPPHFFCLCFFYPVPSWSPSACVSVPLPGSLSLETGLVAWLPSAAWVVFCVSACAYARARVHVGLFLWGWDQMASNRSSWSPWLPGWQSSWERHILQPGAVRPFLREIIKKKFKKRKKKKNKRIKERIKIKALPSHFTHLLLPWIQENVACASVLHRHPLTWLEEEQSRLVFLSAWHRHKSEPHLWEKLPFPLLLLWKVWIFTFFYPPQSLL